MVLVLKGVPVLSLSLLTDPLFVSYSITCIIFSFTVILRWEKAAVLLSKQWAPSSMSLKLTRSVPCRRGKTLMGF